MLGVDLEVRPALVEVVALGEEDASPAGGRAVDHGYGGLFSLSGEVEAHHLEELLLGALDGLHARDGLAAAGHAEELLEHDVVVTVERDDVHDSTVTPRRPRRQRIYAVVRRGCSLPTR